MSSLEEKIRTALADGIYNIEVLSEGTGIPIDELYSYARQRNIDIKKELRKNYIIALIKYKKEKKTTKEISELTHRKQATVSNDLRSIGIQTRRRYKRITEEDITNLKRLEKAGLSAYIISHLTSRADGTVKKYLDDETARQKLIQMKARDERIRQGLSLDDIAAPEDITRQAISRYIRETGQREMWREKRDEIRQTKPTRKTFIRLLNNRARQLMCRESWAYAMTQEYYRLHRRASLDKTMKFYEAYIRAKTGGERLSNKVIAAQSGCSFQNAVKLLSFAGCRSLFREHDNCPVTTETMIQLSELGMSEKDIGYFCNIHNSGVALRFCKIKYRPKTHILKRLGPGRQVLTYRRASEIYKAADLGYNHPEICELLDTNENVVDYALEKRNEIGAVIEKAKTLIGKLE
jgi:predicted DNA-binding protein YlxM (UPF0122 family)